MLTCGTINTATGVIRQVSIGIPQGNVASPTIANIVLDRLDKFLEKYQLNFESGIFVARKKNKQYISVRNKIHYTKDH